MRKIASLLVAAGLVLGSAMGASAIEFEAGGSFEMGYYWADHSQFNDLPQDKFGAATRIQLRLDAIANENLRGTYQARIGTTSWGVNGTGTGPNSGYGIGTQGVNVRTLEAYLSFRWPGTNLKLRMGLFPMRAPQAVKGQYTGSMIMDERAAGLEAVYEFNKNVSVVAHWSRLANQGDGAIADSSKRNSKVDVIMLAVPVTTDIINVTPWGMYGQVGKNSGYYTGSPNNPYHASSAQYLPTGADTQGHQVIGDDGRLWWGGLALEVTALDNWILKGDVIYGSYRADYTNSLYKHGANVYNDMGFGSTNDPKREGWLFDIQIGYKLDYFTPTLMAFYSTGDDYSDWKNNESGRIPVLSNLGGWTSLGGMNSIAATSDGIDRKLMNSQGYTGMWGVMLALEDIKFIDKLTSCFRVMYMQGTNDNDIIKASNRRGNKVSPWYLGTSDSAWEFNFNHEYKLYENLGFWVELGYIILDRDSDNEPTNAKWQSKNASSIFTGFYYKF